MYKYLLISFSLLILSCDEDPVSPVEGCTIEEACNFNPDADIDDGTCVYAEEHYDCEGLCISPLDCLGDCAGTATEDNCGTCDDDPSNDCTADCNGDFGGSALEDNCGVCDYDSGNDCVQDCNADWGGTAVEDSCGVCSGGNTGHVYDSDIDQCGVCFGDDSSCSGCTDSTACNYDNTATLDDGTCIPQNECSLCEECDLSEGTIYLTNDSELWYNVTETINGFQFDIYGVTITGISDGDAQNSGFEVTYTNGSTFSRVLGYSTSGSSVAPGCGTLLNISFEGTVTSVSDILFATTFGEPMNIDYTACP